MSLVLSLVLSLCFGFFKSGVRVGILKPGTSCGSGVLVFVSCVVCGVSVVVVVSVSSFRRSEKHSLFWGFFGFLSILVVSGLTVGGGGGGCCF